MSQHCCSCRPKRRYNIFMSEIKHPRGNFLLPTPIILVIIVNLTTVSLTFSRGFFISRIMVRLTTSKLGGLPFLRFDIQ